MLFTPTMTSPDVSPRDAQRKELEVSSQPWSHLVKYLQLQQSSLCPINSVSLQLINRQLHIETLAIQQRQQPSYVLDVAIVNELKLWPTWISVPFLTRRVDEVYVSFRTVTTTKLGWTRKTNRWLGGGTPPLAWGFYSMLCLFLTQGPAMYHQKVKRKKESDDHSDLDRRISIRTLNLDVLTPTDVGGLSPNLAIGPPDWKSYSTSQNINRLRNLRSDSADTNYIIHPEMIVDCLTGQINLLLNSPTGLGRILYERIRTILIMLDGEVRQEWDLVPYATSV